LSLKQIKDILSRFDAKVSYKDLGREVFRSVAGDKDHVVEGEDVLLFFLSIYGNIYKLNNNTGKAIQQLFVQLKATYETVPVSTLVRRYIEFIRFYYNNSPPDVKKIISVVVFHNFIEYYDIVIEYKEQVKMLKTADFTSGEQNNFLLAFFSKKSAELGDGIGIVNPQHEWYEIMWDYAMQTHSDIRMFIRFGSLDALAKYNDEYQILATYRAILLTQRH